MPIEIFDFVIPLFQPRWNTRAVLEGLTHHYGPRSIHIITSESNIQSLERSAQSWQIAPIRFYPEETFFQAKTGLTKADICAAIDLGESLYNPGWFYQQLLKLGASEGIDDLGEWYAVWDSDLLPVATWPLIQNDSGTVHHSFALLQHNQYGNNQIVSTWATWIRSVLGVEPITDPVGTFIPHHMWFKQEYLQSFQQQLGRYFQSDESWLLLMMRSANEFGTFSEYWAYASWVAAVAPTDLAFYPYDQYGATTERFFDDGTGLFSASLRKAMTLPTEDQFAPAYSDVGSFIKTAYGEGAYPSSLSFESSPRHLKKAEENMHIEERRSRWNLRNTATSEPSSSVQFSQKTGAS